MSDCEASGTNITRWTLQPITGAACTCPKCGRKVYILRNGFIKRHAVKRALRSEAA